MRGIILSVMFFLKTLNIDSTDKTPLVNQAGIRLNLY